MTIDERLEAIAQSLEVLNGLQHANERRFAEIASTLQQDAENIRALARIAEIHERRLSDLET